MFPALQLEILDRFTAVEQYFRATRPFRGDTSQTAKGLVFVQIYAIHEYAVQNVVRVATTEIASHAPAFCDLRPSLLALFLDPEIQSLRDCPAKDRWDRRMALFNRATSRNPVELTSSPIPGDDTNFRHTHLELILEVLGVRRKLTIRRRHMYDIDQTVNNRNSIAHGGETAAQIGCRYSRRDIWRSIRRLRKVSLRLILVVSEHCSDPAQHRR
jgi:hypothetical protein